MKVYECSKCQSKDVFIQKSGNQVGLFCGDCGKWIKWLNKDEQRLAERQVEMMKDTVVQQMIDSMKKGKETL